MVSLADLPDVGVMAHSVTMPSAMPQNKRRIMCPPIRSTRVSRRGKMAFSTNNAIGYCAGQSIGQRNQHRTDQQGRAGANIVKDEKLRNDIEENCDCNDVPNRQEPTTQHFNSVFSVEGKGPKKRRQTVVCIFDSSAHSQ